MREGKLSNHNFKMTVRIAKEQIILLAEPKFYDYETDIKEKFYHLHRLHQPNATAQRRRGGHRVQGHPTIQSDWRKAPFR